MDEVDPLGHGVTLVTTGAAHARAARRRGARHDGPAMAVLLTWNVAGRVGRNQERQIAALAQRPFDVLCLQEITPRTRERWVEALEAQGLRVAVSEWPVEPTGSRRFAVLIAAREPLRPIDAPN